MGLSASDRTRSIPVISGILISTKSRSIGVCDKNSAPEIASSKHCTNCSDGNLAIYFRISSSASGSSSIAIHFSGVIYYVLIQPPLNLPRQERLSKKALPSGEGLGGA